MLGRIRWHREYEEILKILENSGWGGEVMGTKSLSIHTQSKEDCMACKGKCRTKEWNDINMATPRTKERRKYLLHFSLGNIRNGKQLI